jgi:hypothetical protein
LGLEI